MKEINRYGKNGRLLTDEEYARKCEIVKRATQELKELSDAIAKVCSFATVGNSKLPKFI